MRLPLTRELSAKPTEGENFVVILLMKWFCCLRSSSLPPSRLCRATSLVRGRQEPREAFAIFVNGIVCVLVLACLSLRHDCAVPPLSLGFPESAAFWGGSSEGGMASRDVFTARSIISQTPAKLRSISKLHIRNTCRFIDCSARVRSSSFCTCSCS